jgi:hypothetical protein
MMKQRIIGISLVSSLLFFTGLVSTSYASSVAPPSPEAGWLATMNYYRSASGLMPVTEDPKLSAGESDHVTYLAKSDPLFISGQYANHHTENPASPFSTKAGIAASGGNLTTGSTPTESEPIDDWMSAPFHAIGILRENLRTSGFAEAFNVNSGVYEQGVSVLSGLVPAKRTKNILFPGPNSEVRFNTFTGEYPDPRESCGTNWQSYLGLPIWASLTSPPPQNVSATLTAPNGPVLSTSSDLCIVDKWNFKTSDFTYGPTGKTIMAKDNLVLILSKKPLDPGNYQVKLSVPGSSEVAWSFDVIPNLPAQITVSFPTAGQPNLFTWAPVTGSVYNTVLGYEVILTNTSGKPPQTFNVSGTSFNDSSLVPGDYLMCVRALGTTGNSACVWWAISPKGSAVDLSPAVQKHALLDKNGVALTGTIHNPTTLTWNLSGPGSSDPRAKVLNQDVHLRAAGDSKDLQTIPLTNDQSSFSIPKLDNGDYSMCLVAKNGYGVSPCRVLGTFWVMHKRNQIVRLSYTSRGGIALKGSTVTLSSVSSSATSGVVHTASVCSLARVGRDLKVHGKKVGTCRVSFANAGDAYFLAIEKQVSLKFH